VGEEIFLKEETRGKEKENCSSCKLAKWFPVEEGTERGEGSMRRIWPLPCTVIAEADCSAEVSGLQKPENLRSKSTVR